MKKFLKKYFPDIKTGIKTILTGVMSIVMIWGTIIGALA